MFAITIIFFLFFFDKMKMINIRNKNDKVRAQTVEEITKPILNDVYLEENFLAPSLMFSR